MRLLVVVCLMLTACGAAAHERTTPDGEARCQTIVRGELVGVTLTLEGPATTPALRVTTGVSTGGVAEEIPLAGDVELAPHAIRIRRADETGSSFSPALCPDDPDEIQSQSGGEVVVSAMTALDDLEIPGVVLRARCRYLVTVAEC